MIAGSAGPGPGSSTPGSSIWSRWRDSFGEAHLALDAVVAHVDGELAPGPARRATEHVERCLLCAGEVAAQRRTRGLLRGADVPGASTALLSALRAIPDESAPPSSPVGLGPSSPGGDTDAPRDDRGDDRGDDRRDDADERGGRGRRGGRSRRRGLPVVLASGLAIGTVALAAVPAAPMTGQIARSIGPGAALTLTGPSRALPTAQPRTPTALPTTPPTATPPSSTAPVAPGVPTPPATAPAPGPTPAPGATPGGR